jgi:hypothetical protein
MTCIRDGGSRAGLHIAWNQRCFYTSARVGAWFKVRSASVEADVSMRNKYALCVADLQVPMSDVDMLGAHKIVRHVPVAIMRVCL